MRFYSETAQKISLVVRSPKPSTAETVMTPVIGSRLNVSTPESEMAAAESRCNMSDNMSTIDFLDSVCYSITDG